MNGILKEEYELSDTFPDSHTALGAAKVAVYKYNNKRPHLSIDFMFPVDAHRQSGPLKKAGI
nr:hypothetical protein [Sunxiuqinia sp.]